MKESVFQSWCIQEAATHGWVAKHVPTPMKPIGGNRFVPDSRGRGLLDLLLIHENPPRMIFAECKNETGKLSADQVEMLRLLRQVSALTLDVDGNRMIGVYVWMPAVADLVSLILRTKNMDAS